MYICFAYVHDWCMTHHTITCVNSHLHKHIRMHTWHIGAVEPVSDAVITPCRHVFCRECIVAVVSSPPHACPTCRNTVYR